MQRFRETFWTTRNGAAVPLPLPTITVKLAGTETLATIYSDNGLTTKTNPFIGSTTGETSFYAADGRYDITATKPGYTPVTLTDVLLDDSGVQKYDTAESELAPISELYRERLSIRRFQRKYDGTLAQRTDQAQACFDYASANGLAVVIDSLPGHEWEAIETTGNVHIIAEKATVLLKGATIGFNAILSGVDDEFSTEGHLTLETDGDGGTGLRILYPVAGYANRDGERVFVKGVRFRGRNRATDHWDLPLDCSGINGGRYEGLTFRGRSEEAGTANPLQSLNTTAPLAMRIGNYSGGPGGGDHRILACRFHAYNDCIEGAENMEGITASLNFALNVNRFIKFEGPAPVHLQVTQNHINAYRGGIRASNVQQGLYTGNTLYRNPFVDSSDAWIGIDLVNPIDTVIDENTYVVYRQSSAPSPLANIATAVKVRGASTSRLHIGDGENYRGTYGDPLDYGIDANDAAILARSIRFPTPGKPVFDGNFRVADVALPTTHQIFGDVRQAKIRLTTQQDFSTGTTPTAINWGANGTIIEDSIGISVFGGEIAFPTETFGRGLQVSVTMRWAQRRNDTIVGVNERGAVMINDGVVVTRTRIPYDPDGDTHVDLYAEFGDDDGGLTSILAWQNTGNTMKLVAAEIVYRLV